MSANKEQKTWLEKVFTNPAVIIIMVAIGLLGIGLVLGFAGLTVPGVALLFDLGKFKGRVVALIVGIVILVLVNLSSIVTTVMIARAAPAATEQIVSAVISEIEKSKK